MDDKLIEFDMEPYEFYIRNKVVNDDGSVTFHLIPKVDTLKCDICNREMIKHGTYERNVRDLPYFSNHCGLMIHLNRYYCKECDRTQTLKFQSIEDKSRLTNRLRSKLCKESLSKPFLTIGKEYSLSDTVVKRAFNEEVAKLDSDRKLYAPTVLGIDENHLNKLYRAVFVDVEKRILLEMFKVRNQPDIENFIDSLPNKENIKVVTIDMWKPYRRAIYATIPNAVIVVDKFHVIKQVINALESIRIRVTRNAREAHRPSFHFNKRLLLKGNEKLTKVESDRLKILFSYYPELERPYYAKELFRAIYHQPNRAIAEKWYKDLKSILPEYDEIGDYNKVVETIDLWYKEIFNYYDYQYTNAITEHINGDINKIALNGKGYSFETLRYKALYDQSVKKYTVFQYMDEPEEPDKIPRKRRKLN